MTSFTLTAGAFEALDYLAPRTRIKVIDAVVMKIFGGKDPEKLPKKAMMAYLLLLEIASAQAAAQAAAQTTPQETPDSQEPSTTQDTSDASDAQPAQPTQSQPAQPRQPAKPVVHSGRPMDALRHIRSRKARRRR
ncbi:MAG: hypothetical protein K2I18_07290 [Paramuribaculum sp.]|nr:hypothetical protein [Paramuribaculum sp.]